MISPTRRNAAAKAAQRRRRKAGLEEVRALVNMPKFISWLVWDGRLKDAKNPAAIKKALEDFLREQYALMADEPSAPEYNFRFARGSFGAEFTTLRDRPKEVVGILQREGEYDWRDLPKRQLITRRKAALRVAVPPLTSPDERADAPPGARMFYEVLPDEREPAPPASEEYLQEWRSWHGYDEEEDVEESSAELSDEAIADCFDGEGYEQ